MLIDLRGGKMFLEDCVLESSQKSQLSYWNFKKNIKGYEAKSDEDGELLTKIVKFFTDNDIALQLTKESQDLLNRYKNSEVKFNEIIQIGKSFKKGKLASEDKTKVVTSHLKKIPARPLKDHQLKAATHLYLVKNGANFSVPGSGKTSVVLTVYEKLRLEGKVNTLFVVGPPSCFQPWRHEFKATLNRNPKYRILAGGNPVLRKSAYFVDMSKKPELVLSTFQTLLHDRDDISTFMFRKGMKIFC